MKKRHRYEKGITLARCLAIANYSDGFRGSFLRQKAGTDKGIAIILWDEADDMDANQSAVTQTIMQQMAP